MQIINVLLFISIVSGGVFQGSLGLIGQFPKGEFKEQGVPTGFGINGSGIFYLNPCVGLGLNIGYGQYGRSSRQIPFNYFSDLITIEEKTTNSIGGGHFFFRIKPFNKTKIQPYTEGLVGLKHLTTTTGLYNNNCTDDSETSYDDCEIASSTNASDIVFSYGFGVGIDVLLGQNFNESGDLYFFINTRYLYGGEAKYLKQGDIEFSDPADGPVITTFNWSESATDLLQISFGLLFDFDN